MRKSIKNYWTRKTKAALVLGIGVAIFCAIWWFYVWPSQLYALEVGLFVFLFVALFNKRGIGCGLFVGIVSFMLFVPFTESFGNTIIIMAVSAMVVVATGEKLISRNKNIPGKV